MRTLLASCVALVGLSDSTALVPDAQKWVDHDAACLKQALSQRGLTVDVAVEGEGTTDPVLTGTTEHDYAYNRRVELNSK